jgi:hypothetical protein
MTKRLRSTAAVLLASGMLLTTATSSEASSILGGLTFGGVWLPTGGTGIGNATGVDILGDSAMVTCTYANACTGDYAALNGNNTILASYNDFQFAPLGGLVNPLWSFNFNGIAYSFSLASVSIVAQNSTALALSGTGTLRMTGREDTEGSWSFSGDTSSQWIFAFSSTTTSPPSSGTVPEGGSTMAILGLGLLVVGALRRRFSA